MKTAFYTLAVLIFLLAVSPPSTSDEVYPRYNVGTVEIHAGTQIHKPYVYTRYVTEIKEYGVINGCADPLNIAEMFETLTEIQYSEDFQVVIDGEDARYVGYSWYAGGGRDEEGRDLYHDASMEDDYYAPNEPGVYVFVVNVTWHNDATWYDYKADRWYRESTKNYNVFKIVK